MQVEHAVADGYDIRGLMYWTLIDNFEVMQQFCSLERSLRPRSTQ